MSYLERILEDKFREVEAAKARQPLEELKSRIGEVPVLPRPFIESLRESRYRPSLIAEIKRRSPSRGDLNSGLDVARWAELYERSGAAAISVLTDGKYFGGSLDDLKTARGQTILPVLRKDFIIDEYQVYESVLWGADAILLIVAALQRDRLEALYGLARLLGLDVLAEVHSDGELAALQYLTEAAVGINNRDLQTFAVDLDTTRILSARLEGRFVVSESGISGYPDVQQLRSSGVHAMLIGEAIITSADPAGLIGELLGA
ncbi:MAG: indole-3-glycerol phosphate synthase TrpC [Candidatus Omnitrophica bacterium]|nr:indole-3-glycerol phosphate synthase TrpC [Candidatus Omnitrophota bacterium]